MIAVDLHDGQRLEVEAEDLPGTLDGCMLRLPLLHPVDFHY